MTTFQVRDGARLLTFDGLQLGRVSSERSNSPRWTELAIYQTVGGSYVLEKVGRSVVTHVPGCPEILGELPRFQEAHPGEDPDDYHYHDCVPESYNFTQLLTEQARYWALVSKDAAEIVDALRIRRRSASEHMPRLSVDLLNAVSRIDAHFEDSWRVEHIA